MWYFQELSVQCVVGYDFVCLFVYGVVQNWVVEVCEVDVNLVGVFGMWLGVDKGQCVFVFVGVGVEWGEKCLCFLCFCVVYCYVLVLNLVVVNGGVYLYGLFGFLCFGGNCQVGFFCFVVFECSGEVGVCGYCFGDYDDVVGVFVELVYDVGVVVVWIVEILLFGQVYVFE